MSAQPTLRTAAVMSGRGSAVGVASLLSLIMFGGTAAAYWTSSGAGIGSATAGTLHAPGSVQVSPIAETSTQLRVQWTAPVGGAPVTGYRVTSDGDLLCATSALTCDATGLASDTEYAVVVTSLLSDSWTASAAAVTGRTNAPAATLDITNPAEGATDVSTMPTITGTSSAAGDVDVKVYAGESANGTPVFSATTAADGSTSWQVAVTPALQAGQPYTASASQTSPGGTTTISRTFTTAPAAPTDTTRPTVGAPARNTAERTNAGSVSWTVTFSEPVSGVDATDFQLVGTGTSGATVTSVTGGSTIYTVTATTGADGTLGLNVLNDGTIKDAALNVLSGTATGQPYTVDKTAPTPTGVSSTNGGTAGRMDSGDTLRLQYSEQMSATSLISSWDGTGTRAITVRVTDGADTDVLSFETSPGGPTIPLGSVALGNKKYVKATITFTATLSVSGTGLATVTLGTPSDSGKVETVTNSGNSTSNNSSLTWSADAGAKDLAGNAASTTPLTPATSTIHF